VQFGTPRELFERPSHTFVGYFIGSPGMNLIDVRAEADGVVLAMPSGVAEGAQRAASKAALQVGIRPEFVQCGNTPSMRCGARGGRRRPGHLPILTLDLAGALKARLARTGWCPAGPGSACRRNG
jgi:glycerol transport system ATP-binding protein